MGGYQHDRKDQGLFRLCMSLLLFSEKTVTLEEAVKGKDMEVKWMPYKLRPYPTETLKPKEHYLQSTWKQSAYPMAEQMKPLTLTEGTSCGVDGC